MASTQQPPRPSLSERMKGILNEYGGLALTIYLILFALVLAGFAVAISLGFQTDSAAGSAGTLAAAWLATKLTQPLRILATLALTPLAAKLLRRLRPPPVIAEPQPRTPPSPPV